MAGVASAVLIIVNALFINSLGILKTSQLKSSYISFVANLRATLEDPHTCEVLLRGQQIAGGNPGDTNFNLVIGETSPNFISNGPLKAGWESGFKEFQITEARMTTNGSVPGFNDPVRGLKYDKPPGTLLFSYNVTIGFNIIGLNPTGRGTLATGEYSRYPEYKIDLIVNIDSGTGQIVACHGVNTLAEACELAGGAYDGSPDMNATPQYRCHPYQRCWVDQGGIRQTPETGPNIAATPPNCPWPYNSPSWVGRLNGSDLWICQWCNNGQWNPGVN